MAGLNPADVWVLIPAYNAAGEIVRVLEKVREKGYRVLVVDDGSADATAERARSVNGTEVLVNPRNRGKGAALRRGLESLLTKDGRAVILMDSDGQHDPSDLDLFLGALREGQNDVIVGNRMGNPTGMPWLRRATNRIMSWIISAAARQTVQDSQCGYRALHRRVMEKLELRTDRFEIESEMLLDACRKGFRVGSVPISSLYRGEASQINPLPDSCRFFKFLFGYYFSKKT